MCLKSIIKRDINTFGVGRKMFGYGDEDDLPSWVWGDKRYETERLYSEAQYENHHDDNLVLSNEKYGHGYHVFLKDSRLTNYYNTKDVLYFGGFVIGIDDDVETVVAKYMFILPDKLNVGQAVIVSIVKVISNFINRR